MDKDFGLIDKIIDGIMQSDEWNKALLDNERMKQEEKNLLKFWIKSQNVWGKMLPSRSKKRLIISRLLRRIVQFCLVYMLLMCCAGFQVVQQPMQIAK